jgi:hypothetical protein
LGATTSHNVAQQAADKHNKKKRKNWEELAIIPSSELTILTLKTLLLTFPTTRIGVTYWQFYLRFVALGVKLTGKNQ